MTPNEPTAACTCGQRDAERYPDATDRVIVPTAADCPVHGSSAAKVDLAALREKHDPVARNLVTVWRSELLALIDVAEAAWDFLASDNEPAAHSRLNDALDHLEFDRG